MEKIQTTDGYRVGGVTVDLSKYTGKDTYSDGGIEDEILAAVKSGRAQEVLTTDKRWPILYHLSDMRGNLLSWLDIGKDKRVLEIGGGCGAVTGVLAAQSGHVDMVEISPRRAEIAAYRNQEYDNITIHVGNLNDMHFAEKFDCITLIGVLEYAGSFTHTDNPYEDFLENCRQLLKPDGALVVAIENRLGMKYFSGAHEDHTGKRFDGITGYNNISHVRTFSHQELAGLLETVGFKGLEWYYPYPDYKLPSDVFSDKCEPTPSEIRYILNFTMDADRLELFSEKEAMASICEAGLFGEFTNSFLVLAHLHETYAPHPVEKVHVALQRGARYSVATSFVTIDGKKYVKKTALTEAARAHIKTIVENSQILAKRLGAQRVADSRLTDDGQSLLMEYIEGTSFTDLMLQALREDGIKAFLQYLEFYWNNVIDGNGKTSDIHSFAEENRYYDMDCNFDNVIVTDQGEFVRIDYEWLVPDIRKEVVLYNSIAILLIHHEAELGQYGITQEKLEQMLGITEEIFAALKKMREEMAELVMDAYLHNYQKRRLTLNI